MDDLLFFAIGARARQNGANSCPNGPSHARMVQTPAQMVQGHARMVQTPAQMVQAHARMVQTPTQMVQAHARMVQTPTQIVQATPEWCKLPPQKVKPPHIGAPLPNEQNSNLLDVANYLELKKIASRDDINY